MSADEYQDFGTFDDSFEEPVHEHAMEPIKQNKQASPNSIRLVKVTTQTVKDFVKSNPNSYVIVSCRSKGILRLDPKRNTKYEVMLVPSFRDELKQQQLNT